jgi:tetratricopeptide (TPR) repeat protein
MSNLANAYYQLSRRRRDAVKLFEQIVEARRQTLGADHPDTLTSMHDLAVTYSTLGRRDEAIKLLESNITMRRAVLGPDHRDTLKSMYNLATSLLYQGRREDAINLLSDTLAAQRRVLGSDHLDTLRSINGLADAYLAANRREDAIPMYQECLAGRIRRVGAEHPDTATTMKSFADALESAGDHAQAIPLYEKVVTVRAKCFGYDHNATQAAIKRLLNTYQNAGRHRDAIKFLAVNLAASSEKLSVEHPFTLRCMNDLAFELSMLGNDEAAHEIAQLKSDDHLDRLRQVPAFQRLVIDFRSRPVFGGEQVKSVGQWTIRFYAFTDARKIESGDWTALIRGKPIVEKLIDRIDFSWDGSPAPGVPADNWITVATTKVTLTAGNYLFESVADDGVRVWIDDKLIIENWSGHPPMLDSAEVKLDSGSHLIKIAHFDYSQSALLRFGVARLDEKEPSRTKRE